MQSKWKNSVNVFGVHPFTPLIHANREEQFSINVPFGSGVAFQQNGLADVPANGSFRGLPQKANS